MQARDQAASPFSEILQQLCLHTGAHAAALVDQEGETVDYAGRIDPFELRVAAAEWQLVMSSASAAREQCGSALGDTLQLTVRAQRASYLIARLDVSYCLVVCLPRRCFQVSAPALSEALHALTNEAGLERIASGRRGRWVSLTVRTSESDRRRPTAACLNGEWSDVEVLGRLTIRAARGRVAYRARLKNGAELTLVREPFGKWYFEEHW